MPVKIFITRNIPAIGIDLLKEQFDLEIYPGRQPISREELKATISHVSGILCLVTDRIDAEIMDAAPRLKIISNHAVGYDNVDVAEATRRGIAVTNTPGVLTEATADLAWALLLAAARKIVPGDRLMRSGTFTGWDPLLLRGAELYGKTLGIIGAGRIGSAVARRSAGWRMKILYFNRSRRKKLESELGAVKVSLPELLGRADFISVHLPLSGETRHFLGEAEFRLMKPTAILINTARGPIVDEKALTKALQEKEIAAAGLDVFENEPQMAAGLDKLDNVVLLPHLGSATVETRNKMAEMAAQNLIRFFAGKENIYLVNPEIHNTAIGKDN